MQKVATCCYCGAKTALNLKGTVQHELSCGACGAPLSKLKALRTPKKETVRAERSSSAKPKPQKAKSRKKKSSWGRMLKKAFDDVDDIFDIFD